MEKQDLIKILNLAFEAVDESKCGPIMNFEKKEMNHIGYNTLMYTISAMLPKNLNMDLKDKTGEDWKK